MERFYLDQNISAGEIEISEPEAYHKIKDVLRGKIGAELTVFGNNQKEFLAEIQEIGKKAIKIKTIKEIFRGTEPTTNLILYPALIKKNRFETILEKCTEIGVLEFRPIISERSVVKIEDSPDRWQKIITEAAQQSGRLVLPKIYHPVRLEQALNSIKTGKVVVAAEGQAQNNPEEMLKNAGKEIHLFIGPEGGWSDQEIELLKKYNPIMLNLGDRILRAETASIIFSAFCIYLRKE